jgi:hypothetical protein
MRGRKNKSLGLLIVDHQWSSEFHCEYDEEDTNWVSGD